MRTTCILIKCWKVYLFLRKACSTKTPSALVIIVFYCNLSTSLEAATLKWFWLGNLFLQCNNFWVWESHPLCWTVAYKEELFWRHRFRKIFISGENYSRCKKKSFSNRLELRNILELKQNRPWLYIFVIRAWNKLRSMHHLTQWRY